MCRQTQNRRTRLPVHPCRREHVVQTLTCCTRTQLRADSKFSCSTRGLSPIIPGVLFRLPRVRSFARTQKKKKGKERKGKEIARIIFYFETLLKRSANYIVYIENIVSRERVTSFILFRDEVRQRLRMVMNRVTGIFFRKISTKEVSRKRGIRMYENWIQDRYLGVP